MTIGLLNARIAPGFAGALVLVICAAAQAQTTPGQGGQGGSPGAQPGTPSAQPASPPGAQPPTPAAQPPSPPGSQPGPGIDQPAYPSATSPRGTTPQQRRQQQQQGNLGSQSETVCNQENELARSECLRRDMTDDDDLPAGVTRSMHQRRQQARSANPADAANSADPRSDDIGVRSRTRTATTSTPAPRVQSSTDRDRTSTEQAPPSDANNQADTLGGER